MTTRLDGAAQWNVAATRGRDFLEEIIISGNDWTDRTFTASIATDYDQTALTNMIVSTPTLAGGNTTFNVTVTDTVMGGATIPAAPVDSTQLDLVYDIQMTDSAGIKTTLLFGKFSVYGKV